MALFITPTSVTATITVTKTLYDIVSLTTLNTAISPSPTANIANTTPTFSTNGTTSTFSPFASLTSNSSNITTSTTTKKHHAAFLVIIWLAILLMVMKSKSSWLDFLRYDVNSQIRAEREKRSAENQIREAEMKEQLERIDEEEAAHKKKIKDVDKSVADFYRIVRFRTRAMNFLPKR
ncbi:uncharacterized protein EAF01_010569 [Botrytis porri]|uniref:uncharacterized protein n=1 Tax=Botrytis porri TaxID=87229 RepID=UPI0018FF154D|nr:uncharacterized protein EAF01_010569 [Botrytis porri]KAF7890760.1 hypothetical protein EAF01_010569 [Botrytis porri]